MQRLIDSPWVIVPLLAIAVPVAFGIAWLLSRGQRAKTAPKAMGQPASPWVWVFFIGVVAMTTYFLGDGGKKPHGRPPATFWQFGLAFFAVLGAMVIVVGSLILFQSLKFHDRHVSRARRRAKAGDLNGAIAELRAAIAEHGPSVNRCAGLGLLLIERKEWVEALPWFREGFDLSGGGRDDLRNNLAIALVHDGSAGEALELMKPLIAQEAPQPIYLINFASALTKLGRLEEAQVVMDRAQEVIARLTKGRQRIYEPILDFARDEMATARKTRTTFDEPGNS